MYAPGMAVLVHQCHPVTSSKLFRVYCFLSRSTRLTMLTPLQLSLRTETIDIYWPQRIDDLIILIIILIWFDIQNISKISQSDPCFVLSTGNHLMFHRPQRHHPWCEPLGVVHADHLVTEPLGGTSVASCAVRCRCDHNNGHTWPSQQEAREFSQFCMYPLVNVYITMENHHFQWVNHGKSTISMAIFNSVTNYQRVHECWLHSHSKYTKIYWYYKMNHPASSSRPSPPQAQPWSCPWHSSMTGSKPLSK
jgi:hypothetical protein